MIDERASMSRAVTSKAGISEDAYEIMTASADNCDNEYLLPNSALKPENTYLTPSGSHENANYEYIQYSQVDNQAANSSDSGSVRSSKTCMAVLFAAHHKYTYLH